MHRTFNIDRRQGEHGMMREVDRLRRELDATLGGDPWYGSAVLRILDGIDAGQAAAHPVKGGHSVWELVTHMTAWVNETHRRLRGGVHATPVEGDWPAVGSTAPESWTAALSRLRQAHDDLARTLVALGDTDLDRQVAGDQVDASGQPVTLYQTAAGILQHDAYHAGQIALLKKALG
jgi:uncharacterized damage-inducible protein DinB